MKKKTIGRLPTLLELISEEVDVNYILEKITFGDHALIEAALEQPKLMREVTTLRVQCMHKRAAIESRISLESSLLSQRFRKIRNSSGKRENTEGAVKAYVETQPLIIKLRKRLNDAFAQEELAKGLVDVYKQRKDVIRIIVDAGKISLQAQEIELLKGSKKLRSVVRDLASRHRLTEI
jgi:hypothetical protein